MTTSNNRKRLLVWGYLVEFFAAISLTVMLLLSVQNGILNIEDVEKVISKCHDLCNQAATTGAISWVVILILPFALIGFLGEEFKNVLLKNGAVTVYVAANIVAAFSFFLAFVIVSNCKGESLNWIFAVIVFIQLYAFINILTVCKNAMGLLWLAQKYSQLKKGQV